MTEVNNILSSTGQAIRFKLDGPITGVEGIEGFTDKVTGEDQFKFIEKEFRFTTDAINWGNWIELTDQNLQQIDIKPQFDFDIEYRYTRRGSEGGEIEWCWINLNTVKADTNCGEAFSDSIFAQFFNCCCDQEVLNWCTNVLEKVYASGIVSKSLVRNQNRNLNNEDRDYIDFWRSITCYFALFVAYARKFENLDQEQSLLTEYLTQRGMYLSSDQPLDSMQTLMKRYHNQISKRSTIRMVQSSEEIDGELLRLTSYDAHQDEFLFSSSNSKTCGWSVNQNSPLFRTIHNQLDLIKIYNIPKDAQIASEVFPLINEDACTLVNSSSSLGSVGVSAAVKEPPILEITPVISQKSGISVGGILSQTQGLFEEGLFEEGLFEQGSTPGQNAEDFKVIVSSNITYALSFYMKTTDLSAKISVSGLGFDGLDRVVNPLNLGVTTGGLSVTKLSNVALNKITLPKVDQWYYVRVILFNSSQRFIDDPEVLKTSLGVGNNLKMSNSMIRFAPEVVLDNTNSDIAPSTKISLKNIEFKPLNTDYGKGFVGGTSLIETWMKNNSLQLNEEDINQAVRNDLIPYKMGFVNNFI